MQKSKRRLSNYLRFASLSRRYHVRFFAATLILMLIFMRYVFIIVSNITDVLVANDTFNDTASRVVISELLKLNMSIAGSFFAYILFMTLFIIIIEQRIGGPTKAILKTIEQIKNGEKITASTLRKGDELVPIMSALQDLAKTKNLN